MAGEKRDIPQNQLLAGGAAIQQVANLFFPQKTTEGITGVGATGAQLLLADLLPKAAGQSPQVEALINSIMTKSAQAFAPTLAAGASAGGYNSTVVKQLQNEARARSVAEASSAVLEFQNRSAAVAANLIGTSATRQRTQQPTFSLESFLPSLAAGYIGNKLLKSKAVSSATDKITAPIDKAFEDFANFLTGGSSSATSTAGVSGVAHGGITEGTLEVPLSTSLLEGGGAGATAVGAAGVDALALTGSDALASALAAGFEGAGAEAIAASAVAEAAIPIEAFGGAGAAVGTGAAIGAAEAGGAALAAGGTAAAAEGAVAAGATAAEGAGFFSAVAEALAAAAAWIVCTELVRQKRMPMRWYIAGAPVFASYPEYGKRGYYLWAIPCVKHLRAHPHSHFSRFLARIFLWRAENIAAHAGVRGARKLWRGAAVTAALYPICQVLGVLSYILPLGCTDWKQLYRTTKGAF